MRWNHTPFLAGEVAALSRDAGVDSILAELLLRAGIREPGAAGRFLDPALAGLGDPFLLPNVEAVAARLQAAIVARDAVVVLGDYDVDGVTSTALLVMVLRKFGLNPRFIVPRRSEDGYGLSRSAIDRALEQGAPQLFVALDCGTNSHAEVAYLIGRGIDVIVIDHHREKEGALKQGLLLNPHATAGGGETEALWRDFCTVGLVFKAMHGLLKRLRADNHPGALGLKLRDHLDLVALGTVADLVPLVGENRILARHGLRILRETQRPGLRALMEVAGMKAGQDILPADVSFRLGPRINASGRLADAALSVELLISEDTAFCFETARQLDLFNRERQEIERQMTGEAERLIESEYAAQAGIVLFSEAWHPGVVGIVAGRVTRKYNRPCIVLGNEGEHAKGSGRSVHGVNLVEVLGQCRDHLASWGGHPMAVGVSLIKDRLDGFRRQFADAVRTHVGGDIAEARIDIAAWLEPHQIRERLMDDLATLQPFGQGNPEPIFGLRGVVLNPPPTVFKEQHFRFWFDDSRGRRLHGVAWKMARRLPPAGVPIDLAVELAWNTYNDRRLLQLQLIDWRVAG
jgi:single-stranded-DNA-specific exonuclease